MATKPGLNAGLSGLIDIATSETAIIRAYIEGWDDGTSVSVIDITGPGHGADSVPYLGYQASNGRAQGYHQNTAAPLPENGVIREARGQLTLKFDSSKYFEFPAAITNASFQKDPARSDRVNVQFSWIRTGPMVRVWPEGEEGGDPGEDTTPTRTPTVLTLTSAVKATLINAGTSDTREPHGLVAGANVSYLVSGVADTYAAQLSAATAFVSAQPTLSSLKLRDASPRRVGPDALLLQAQYGLTDHKDDIQFGGSYAVRRYGRPGENVKTTVEAATGTEAAIVEARTAAFFAEANASEIMARKINDAQAAIRRRYVGYDSGVTPPTGPMIGGDTVMLRGLRIKHAYTEAATIRESVSLYVVAINTIATDRYRVEFGTEIVDTPVRRFAISRVYEGLPIDDKWSTVGKLNNAAWNGFPKLTTMYTGATYLVRSNRTKVDYNYEARKEPNIQVIGERIDVIMSSVSGMAPDGYVTVKTLRDNGLAIDALASTADFTTVFGF